MSEPKAKNSGQTGAGAKPGSTSVRNRALDGLIEAGTPWWHRYSAHGEFPWSSAGALIFHLLLVALIVLLARSVAQPDREPLGTQTVDIGTDPEAAEGDGGTDKAGGPEGEQPQDKQEQQQQKEDQAQPQPPTSPQKTAREEVKDVKPEDAPSDMNAPTFDPSSIPSENVPQEVSNRIAQVKKNLEQRTKSGTGGKGGSGSGIGGRGGSGASGKAARAARWVLITQGTDIRSYLVQLDGLGAAFAVPGPGNNFIYFRDVSTSRRSSEQRDLSSENRIYWTFEKPSMVRDFCRFVGIAHADMLVMFLPVELEERMAQMEESYQGKSAEQIAQTRFRVVSKDGSHDVVVVGQTLR